MKMHLLSKAHRIAAFIAAASSCGGPDPASAQGIPEPSLIMYGSVRNANGGGNIRLIVGTLTWHFRFNGGPVATVSTPLTNINDQFSYLLKVPCESEIPGLSLSSNTLKLTSSPLAYDRSLVFLRTLLGTNQASLVRSEQATLLVTSRERGRMERVDLVVSVDLTDADGNGIPDFWERQHFGFIGLDANADPDQDGMSNGDEYHSGTDPTDPNSRFAFINIEPHPDGGSLVEWSSVEGTRYVVERASELLSGFAPIVTGIAATPPVNAYHDRTAAGGGVYFYRLRLE